MKKFSVSFISNGLIGLLIRNYLDVLDANDVDLVLFRSNPRSVN